MHTNKKTYDFITRFGALTSIITSTAIISASLVSVYALLRKKP